MQYITISHTTIQREEQNINQISKSQQPPHISPLRANYGVSVVRILQKFDHVITASHCDKLVYSNDMHYILLLPHCAPSISHLSGACVSQRFPSYVALPGLGQVHGEQLQGDDSEDALQAVHHRRHRQPLVALLHRLVVALVTDQQGVSLQQPTAPCNTTLQVQTACKMEGGIVTDVLGHHYIDGLVQERFNSSALAMELRLSCPNPAIWLP